MRPRRGRWRLAMAAVLAASVATACNTHTEVPPNREQLIAQGELIYVEYCAECHQTDGEGWSTLYPRLAGNPLVTLHDPEPIIVTVTYGLGSMPGFQRRLNSQQIAAVITYVRSAWGNEAAAVSPRQIK